MLLLVRGGRTARNGCPTLESGWTGRSGKLSEEHVDTDADLGLLCTIQVRAKSRKFVVPDMENSRGLRCRMDPVRGKWARSLRRNDKNRTLEEHKDAAPVALLRCHFSSGDICEVLFATPTIG